MDQLHGLVTDPTAYANNLSVPDTAWSQIGTTATLNGCALSWSGLLADTIGHCQPRPWAAPWAVDAVPVGRRRLADHPIPALLNTTATVPR